VGADKQHSGSTAQSAHPTSPLQSFSLFPVCESKRRAIPKQPLDMQSSITKTQDLLKNRQSLLECDTICFMRNVGPCLPNYMAPRNFTMTAVWTASHNYKLFTGTVKKLGTSVDAHFKESVLRRHKMPSCVKNSILKDVYAFIMYCYL